MYFLDYAGWIAPVTYLLCTITISIWLARRTHYSAGLLLFWYVIGAVRILTLPSDLPSDWAHLFDAKSATALAGIALPLAAIYSLSLRKWKHVFQWVGALNAALIIWGAINHDMRGITSNASMSGCFEVALIPLTQNPIIKIFMVISVLLSGQSQPIALLGILTALSLWRGGFRKFAALVPVMAVWVGGWTVKSHGIFDDNGRVAVWRAAYEYFSKYIGHWIGLGTGTFAAVGPSLTRSTGFYFIWLHSDWFQLLFEGGVIGLFFAFLFYTSSILSIANTNIRYALLVIGAWGIANMPLHYPLCALYVAFVFRAAYEPEGLEDPLESLNRLYECQQRRERLHVLIEEQLASEVESLR